MAVSVRDVSSCVQTIKWSFKVRQIGAKVFHEILQTKKQTLQYFPFSSASERVKFDTDGGGEWKTDDSDSKSGRANDCLWETVV